MSLPAAVRAAVEARFGPVRDARPVGGGCIHPALRLELADGPAFLKHAADAPAGLFGVEARGLEALRAAADDALRVPAVLGWGEGVDGGPAWLLLEWLEPSAPGPGFGERLGRGVAALHRSAASGWGWEEDGFIGPLPQENGELEAWAEFWRARRLEPMLRRAADAGRMPARCAEWEELFRRLPDVLAPAEEEGPSLLHGDLWGGNVLCTGGEPAIVDPAAYRGHREADLAMAELFGGMDARALDAYRESFPPRGGYESRRPVHQLWYLLVHVVLFGGGYGDRTAATLRDALARG